MAAIVGFTPNLGGVITLLVSLPANFIINIYLQRRMITAIASIGGEDLQYERVRTMVYGCLLGNGMDELFKELGVQLTTKVASSALQKISWKMFIEINKAVTSRLIERLGAEGLAHLGKAIPLLKGIIGGSIDFTATYIIGRTAREQFIKPL